MLERKYLAHYIDAAFDLKGTNTNYVRVGEGIEELSISMNPEVETTQDIIGNNSATLKSYDISADVDPYYYSTDDALSEKLQEICDFELTGDACKTTWVDVWLKPGATPDAAPIVINATRREVIVAVQSYGGDTGGVQIPFSVNGSKNKTQGDFDISAKKFTEKGL